MAWDDIKQINDQLPSTEWNDHVADQKSRAKVEHGSGAPTSIPSMIGSIYIDTDNNKKYIAIGTSSSSDWKELTNKEDLDNHTSDSSIHFTQAEISISTSQINDFNTSDITVNSLTSNTTIVYDSEYAASSSINWNNGNKQSITLTTDTTLTFTNPSGATNLVLKVVQDSVGGHSITFPSSVKWEGGNAPDTSSDSGDAIRIFTFYFDGTNYFGQFTDTY